MTDLVEVNLVKVNLVNENLDELCLERFILPRPSREALLEGLVSPRRGRCVTRRDATQHRRPTPPPTPSNTRAPIGSSSAPLSSGSGLRAGRDRRRRLHPGAQQLGPRSGHRRVGG